MLVTNIDAPTGGVQRNSHLLVQEFAKRGIRSYVCTRNYYRLPGVETRGSVTFHRSPVFGNSLPLNAIVYFFDTLLWLVRNRDKYSVIHCQQMFGPTMVAAIASFIIAKPIVSRITLSGKTGEVGAVSGMPLASLRLRLIGRVSRWIALTREMADELATLNIPPKKIRIIHNSTEIPQGAAYVPETKLAHRRALGFDFPKIAVFVGRLSEEKNLDVLLNAWTSVSRRHDAHLLLLGAGGDFRNVESDLRKQAAELGLDKRVHFIGHISNAKDYMIAADVFVLPTRAEGMSNALVEAFACGSTIVATDIPANTEICEHRMNSLLVPVGDQDALSEAINLVFDSPDLAGSLGREARRKAERDLSVDKMIDDYLHTYQEVLHGS